jgi:hypothetical protein
MMSVMPVRNFDCHSEGRFRRREFENQKIGEYFDLREKLSEYEDNEQDVWHACG